MRQAQAIMGMPIAVELADAQAAQADFDAAFGRFREIDRRFSTYKEDSEISRINRGELAEREYSDEMVGVLALCERFRKETGGYFDIMHDGRRDPSGLVKGWAIRQVAQLLEARGLRNFLIDAGGDIVVRGTKDGQPWTLGVKHPSQPGMLVKRFEASDLAVATSGLYERGPHIYNPHGKLPEILSVTVIGPDIVTADAYATALFAAGQPGISMLPPGYEAYVILDEGRAIATQGFPA